jgi:hypothetical protein
MTPLWAQLWQEGYWNPVTGAAVCIWPCKMKQQVGNRECGVSHCACMAPAELDGDSDRATPSERCMIELETVQYFTSALGKT